MMLKAFLYAALSTATLHASGEVEKGSSVGNYAKPGASVEMRYESPKVDLLENAEVRIFLYPVKHYAEMKIHLTVDHALEKVAGTTGDFTVKTGKNTTEYPLTVTVRSSEPGIHFIRLIVYAGGKSRAFTIPVHIGERTEDIHTHKKTDKLKIMHAKEVTD